MSCCAPPLFAPRASPFTGHRDYACRVCGAACVPNACVPCCDPATWGGPSQGPSPAPVQLALPQEELDALLLPPEVQAEAAMEPVPSSVHPESALSLFARLKGDPALLAQLGEECLSYAMTHGITMLRHPPVHTNHRATAAHEAAAADALPAPAIMHAPLTLLPTRLPTALYDQVRALTPLFSALYDRVSRDLPFLVDTLTGSSAHDPFVARLLGLLQHIEATPSPHYRRQTIRLALNRSDYMLDEEQQQAQQAEATVASPRLTLKQVEFNTISCGATSLCNRVSDMHRYLLHRFVPAAQLHLPANDATRGIVDGMAHAHRLFIAQQRLHAACTPVVLFVVQARESNMADQKMLEYALWASHRIPVRRMTLEAVAAEVSVDERTGHLWLGKSKGPTAAPGSAASYRSPPQLVSLVYFRAGYTPRDFTSPSGCEWAALEAMERSVAIQCPSLAYHLAGTKKVQQVLATPGVLERFIPDSEAQGTGATIRRQIGAVFAGLWQPSPDTIARALAAPSRFVLKPQREGGGNNLWGADLERALRSNSLEQLQSYVLMSVIGGTDACVSADVPALKGARAEVIPRTVSELGMVGCRISGEAVEGMAAAVEEGGAATATGASTPAAACSSHLATSLPSSSPAPAPAPSPPSLQVYRNSYVGYLLRTKEASLNEGGLMSGAGAVDSLILE